MPDPVESSTHMLIHQILNKKRPDLHVAQMIAHFSYFLSAVIPNPSTFQ